MMKSIKVISALFLLIFFYPSKVKFYKEAADCIKEITNADQKQLIKTLKIDSFRSGLSSRPRTPNATNIEKTKVTPYSTLPDPIKLKGGMDVKNATICWEKRSTLNSQMTIDIKLILTTLEKGAVPLGEGRWINLLMTILHSDNMAVGILQDLTDPFF